MVPLKYLCKKNSWKWLSLIGTNINQQNNTSGKPYLDYLIDPSFQGVNRLFVLSFENMTDKTVHTKYYLPTAEVKNCNVIFDGQNFLDQPEKNDLKISKTCDWSISKIIIR